jgi:SAM-dependent methyltransferase
VPASPKAFWNRVASTYDRVFPETAVGRHQRGIVHAVADRLFHPGQRILELNCGTGIDAVHFAERGVRVVACDLSEGMVDIARRRREGNRARGLVDLRVLPTEEIARLGGEPPFDGVFSNFSGLNHVMDLRRLAVDLAALLRPGAPALLCVATVFSPAESAWHLLRGDVRRATRRLARRTDDPSLVVRYRSARAWARALAPELRLREVIGVGVLLPSCAEPAARRFPATLERMARVDRALGRVPWVRDLSECILLHFEKVSA